jgi:hypothetical protein
LKKGKVNKENTPIAIRNYAAGIYLLKVHHNSKQLKVAIFDYLLQPISIDELK